METAVEAGRNQSDDDTGEHPHADIRVWLSTYLWDNCVKDSIKY